MTNPAMQALCRSCVPTNHLKSGRIAKCILGYRTLHCYLVGSCFCFVSASEFITRCTSFNIV
jgi:hypothetical protein